jgi:hypothetical protein
VPQLLDASLVDRLRHHVESAVRRRPQKVGVVVDAHGELVTVEHVG